MIGPAGYSEDRHIKSCNAPVSPWPGCVRHRKEVNSAVDYTPYSLLVDVGWISLLMVIGNLLRRKVGLFQRLLMPASITAGLLGLLFGPQVLGWINFSDQIGTYTSILIAFVFASMAYSMDLTPSVWTGAKKRVMGASRGASARRARSALTWACSASLGNCVSRRNSNRRS